MKQAHENIGLDTLIERFNTRLSKEFVRMKHQPNNVLMLEEVKTSNQVVTLSNEMGSALDFR